MTRTNRMLTLAAGTALASAMVGGCATHAAPLAEVSAGRAELALHQGKVPAAVAHAEAAVLAEPRNAAYRATLGAAYMEAGRFLSARTSFDDAMKLGDDSARTALGFALASVASGDNGAAIQVLDDWRNDIPAADLGLAFALAGDTQQGVQILSNAVRGGDDTPKTRQNLAYALALNGNWAGARIMAAQDVPADQLDKRLASWAEMARPEATQSRVASLLGTRAVADGGQPAALALANNPSHEQLAAEAAASAQPGPGVASAQVAANAGGELPALAPDASTPVPAAPTQAVAAATPPSDFRSAFGTDAPSAPTAAGMMQAAVDFANNPVVQQAPARLAMADTGREGARRVVGRALVSDRQTGAARADSPAAYGHGSHLVQLGSFSSEAGARRAWSIYAKRFPQLSAFDMVITKAVVRGKTYFRVSAGGLDRSQATSLASSARRKGQGYYAWTEGHPMPGAVDSEMRMASR